MIFWERRYAFSVLFGSHIVLPAKCHGGEYGGVVTVAREAT